MFTRAGTETFIFYVVLFEESCLIHKKIRGTKVPQKKHQALVLISHDRSGETFLRHMEIITTTTTALTIAFAVNEYIYLISSLNQLSL